MDTVQVEPQVETEVVELDQALPIDISKVVTTEVVDIVV